ncbi:hydroxymethylpyrimidine/phosphomethylpyrimidine kinase [bacterium MnTg02]|nr:hydroxymethylpyrimidine/phosphomethylpyrimidine kinase [bacterium MnTg02]
MTFDEIEGPIALSIAGSDSSGGAGIQADIKTFSALKVYGATVVTAITAQNSLGVQAVLPLPPDIILRQMESVFSDLAIRAVKIGMLGNEDAIDAVLEGLKRFSQVPIVLDPVMVATSGDRLLEEDAETALRTRLLPMATLVTPNLEEAALLLSDHRAVGEGQQRDQAKRLHEAGAKAVLVKGGHAPGGEAIDVFYDGAQLQRLSASWIDTKNTHGTGCTLSSAITAFLARGATLFDAVERAKHYVHEALVQADRLSIGRGRGPVHHFHNVWREKE